MRGRDKSGRTIGCSFFFFFAYFIEFKKGGGGLSVGFASVSSPYHPCTHFFFFFAFTHCIRCSHEAPSDRWRALGMIETIQEAGEVIYVPTGWWHAVFNLTHTVCVTQNYRALKE